MIGISSSAGAYSYTTLQQNQQNQANQQSQVQTLETDPVETRPQAPVAVAPERPPANLGAEILPAPEFPIEDDETQETVQDRDQLRGAVVYTSEINQTNRVIDAYASQYQDEEDTSSVGLTPADYGIDSSQLRVATGNSLISNIYQNNQAEPYGNQSIGSIVDNQV
ncbi:hypothetical protein [Echinimonas agarilytica]|uniref:Uncharacterized protein n=1 Tax=Echinimonas agarilytica TaxID=1215918 RepID=A0AA41W4K2_9GAMM|nr:hypothetical protein [Echinimonas agarilytica]MCM2678388.1 hypothetical protein [Echinimonas agarilytica]